MATKNVKKVKDEANERGKIEIDLTHNYKENGMESEQRNAKKTYVKWDRCWNAKDSKTQTRDRKKAIENSLEDCGFEWSGQDFLY